MGRDIQAIEISGEDRRKYRDKVRRSLDVLARMLRERLFEADPSHVGVEIELNLVDSRGAPSMRNGRVLAAIADPAWATQQGVRPRVWFGERWITSVFDLFEENIRYFPALLPICDDEDPVAALDRGACPQLAEMSLHNGTVYRWNRPVYAVVDGKPHLRD